MYLGLDQMSKWGQGKLQGHKFFFSFRKKKCSYSLPTLRLIGLMPNSKRFKKGFRGDRTEIYPLLFVRGDKIGRSFG
jgi:hypothetical protein